MKGGAPAPRVRRRARFAVGDRVRVTDGSPLGHTRKARYVRGKTGEIILAHGTFIYPDSAGNGRGDAPQHVYTVSFTTAELWGEEHGDPNGAVNFDVWEPYLEHAEPIMTRPRAHCPLAVLPRTQEEIAARVKALESIMIEKGIMTTEAVDRLAEIYENEVGPQLGAGVVAKAWSDRTSRRGCSRTPPPACAELGIGGLQGEDMVVVENTDTVHNVIVCTLCSCYPWPVLGLPPNWYKYPAYRSRHRARAAARAARGLRPRRAGLGRDPGVGLHVEMRYWVLPQRPAGTEGMAEEELAALVTRDSMIGIGRPASPGHRTVRPDDHRARRRPAAGRAAARRTARRP